jgi:hypothetical protein
MPTARPERWRAAALAAAALVAAGCAGLPALEMALPSELAGVEPVKVRGIGGGRSGEWRIGDLQGRFDRGADRVDWFGLVQTDSVGAGYSVLGGEAVPSGVRCRGRQATVTWRIVEVPVKPYGVECRWTHGAELRLAAVTHPTRDERVGSYRAGELTLEVRSVHAAKGSPLTLQEPVGYLFLDGGRAVGAVELNGTLRLWRPDAGSALQHPVTEAALALALLWDPAGR